MSLRRSGLNPSAYLGVEPVSPPQFEIHERSPTANDYLNFNVGTLWLHKAPNINPTVEDLYILTSKNAGVATWRNFASGTTTAETLTGNTGGAVGVDVNDNINVVGDGTGITIAGNQATNTLTASLIGGGIASQSFPTDSGTATPNATGVLNVLGGNNIGTTGAGNTVTINVDGTTNHSLQVGNATGSLTSLSVGATGSLLVGVTGSDPAWSIGGVVSISGAGEVNWPLQPAFLAYLNVNALNVTGDGTIYTIAYDTEVYDQNGDFNTATSTFTAPVSGKYQFSATTNYQGFDVNNISGNTVIVTSNSSLVIVQENMYAMAETLSGSRNLTTTGYMFTDMDAGDTAIVTAAVSNGAKQVDILAGIGNTRFAGSLLV